MVSTVSRMLMSAQLYPSRLRASTALGPASTPPAGGPDIFRQIPTLVIGAEDDHVVPVDVIDGYASYFGIERRMLGSDWNLPGHGHSVPIALSRKRPDRACDENPLAGLSLS